jgi:hypothetical protein
MSKDNRRVTPANFARLQLPPPQTPSSAATASECDAQRERVILEWDLGYEEPETA